MKKQKQTKASVKRNFFGYGMWLALSATFVPTLGFSLQPLTEFIQGASTYNLDQKEANLTIEQRNHEWKQALSRLFPSLSVNATYTHNEPTVQIEGSLFGPGVGSIVITPANQIDAVFNLNVPLVDVASWYRAKAADQGSDSARLRSQATWLEIQKNIARLYYQYVAASALIRSAERTLLAAKDNQKIVEQKMEAGTAADIDVSRAIAEVARAEQSRADALLTQTLAGRSLLTITGIKPAGEAPVIEDNLQEEASLESWQKSVEQLPAIRAAKVELEAARTNRNANWLGYAPTLSGALNERLTNATGFGQRNNFFSATLNLTWRADVGTIFAAKAAESARKIAQVREEKARRDAQEQIDNTWHQIQTYVIRSQSARAQLKASKKAAELAHVRYEAGVATQLDVTQAERDLFSADVSTIQTYADLLYSRALLRLQAGQSLLEEEKK